MSEPQIVKETQKKALMDLLDIYRKDSPLLVVPALHFQIACGVVDWLNTEVTQLRKQIADAPKGSAP